MDIKKIKAKAKKKLSGNYVVIIVALIIYGLIEGLFTGTSKLIYNDNMNILFNIIVMGLLYEGLLSISIKIAKGKNADIMDLFKKTDLFWKTAAVTIILTAFTALCSAMIFVAGNSLNVFLSYQTDISTGLSSFMILVGILLLVAIIAFYIVMMIYFSQVYFVLYDNEKMPVFSIFERSMDLVEFHKFNYFIYKLSFIGWAILGIFTFGLLYLWLIPYIMVSDVNFYDELKRIEKSEK